MGEGERFAFLAEHICLDFCNTADGNLRQEWTELLATYDDLLTWSEEAGLLTMTEARELRQKAEQRPADAECALEHAHGLRLTLFEVFAAIACDHTPDLTAFNAEIEDIGHRLRVVATGSGGFHWDCVDDDPALEKMLWPVLWSAAELLTSSQLQYVHQCSGTDCGWLFLDTTRNHSRRWCDMKACGNRAKARRHYHRSKT